MNAVKTGKKGEIIVSPKAANFRRRSVSFDQSVLARANTNDSTKAKNGGNDDDAQKHDANSTDIGLGSINEIEQLNVRLNTEIEQLNALLNTDTKREKPQNQGAVTYRERLGGFLHPRDRVVELPRDQARNGDGTQLSKGIGKALPCCCGALEVALS